jgi:gas vesicle protein
LAKWTFSALKANFPMTHSCTVILPGRGTIVSVVAETMFHLKMPNMKKLLLTGITAALFSVAAIAQEQQDTTRNQNNQYRSTEEMEDDAEQTADSVSTEFQQGVNEAERDAEQAGDNLQREGQELRQDAEQAGDNIQREGQELRQDAEQAGDNINEGVQRTGDDIQQGAEEAGDEIEQNAEQAGDNIRQGAQRTGDEIQQGTQRAGDRIEEGAEKAGDNTNRAINDINNNMKQGADGQNQGQTANYNMAPELEVVEAKEGPNSEVVYKYQDEYFYIDRNEQKLVKVKESELKDAKHEVIVKDGGEGEEGDAATNRSQSDRQRSEN